MSASQPSFDLDVRTDPKPVESRPPAQSASKIDIAIDWQERSAEARLVQAGGVKSLQTSAGGQPLEEFP